MSDEYDHAQHMFTRIVKSNENKVTATVKEKKS